MNPERWQKVKDVLAEAMEVSPVEREACLDRSCAGDASLRREVEILLEHESGAGSRFLNETAFSEVSATLLAAEQSPLIGRQLGAYKTVERIAFGGMGEVYRAVRADDEYRKEVAVKVVSGGRDTEFIVRRFRNERQILASLEHPNIARLLDGGTTGEGTVYFVMELIEGQPITKYCDDRTLAISERLGLFTKVCDAVQYAHQRLIIHRDIKPSNILVTADGTPKLLDFGIAKIVESDSAATPDLTLTNFRILTPRYASPEQIRGESMTTATDVYSLGVVLYELLTGRSPYRLSNATPEQIAQQAGQGQPQRPSLAVRLANDGELRADRGYISSLRDNTPEKLQKLLRGDVDNIVLMALRKDPSRRYASVEQLNDDLRRHLGNLPVLARKDTVRYRASKFVSRHKIPVLAVAAILLAIVAGFGVSLHEARIARTERARAERRFNDVRKLANSLIYEVHDLIQDLPGSTPARKLLISRAIEYLDSLALESAGDALLQAELANAYERIGKVQGGDFGRANLGDNEGALTSFRKMLEIRQRLASANPTNVENQVSLARGYRALADLQAVYLADLKGALDSCTRALAITEPQSKSNPTNQPLLRELAADYEKLGDIQGGGNGSSANLADLNAAVKNHLRSQTLVQKLASEAPTDRYLQRWLAVADYKLQNDLSGSDDFDGAMLHAKEAFEIFERLANQENNTSQKHDIAAAYDALANLEVRQGRFDNALRDYGEEVKLLEASAAADPQNVEYAADLASARANFGYMVCKTGNCKSGIPLLTSAFRSISRIDPSGKNGQIQAAIAGVENSLADALGRTGRRDEASEYYSRARQIYQQIALQEPMDLNNQLMLAGLENTLAAGYSSGQRYDSAIKAYKESLTISFSVFSTNRENIKALYCAFRSYGGLGDTEAALAKRAVSLPQKRGHWKEARSWYEKSLDAARLLPHKQPVDPNGFESPDTRTIVSHLAQCNRQLAPRSGSPSAKAVHLAPGLSCVSAR